MNAKNLAYAALTTAAALTLSNCSTGPSYEPIPSANGKPMYSVETQKTRIDPVKITSGIHSILRYVR